MPEARSFTVAEISDRLGARLQGDGGVRISGLEAVPSAKTGDLTFVSKAKYAEAWMKSNAAAAVVTDGVEIPQGARPLLWVANVEQAMISLLEMFAPPDAKPNEGIHPSAVIDPAARVGAGVRIAANVTVGANAIVGDGVTLHPGVCIYPEATVGDRSILHANVVVRERCVIGRDVIIHQNVSIGADGFGYRPSPDGKGLLKMPHVGNVVIEDQVEIGANSCVDRAKFGSTVIGAGTKIDNLCQIAHNVRIGRCCVMAAQSGIAGSATIGDGTMIGGKVAIVEHVVVGSRVMIGGGSGIMDDVADGERVLGVPATSASDTLKQWALIRKLPALFRDVAQLKRIKDDLTPDKPH